jgi:hypothetical protein
MVDEIEDRVDSQKRKEPGAAGDKSASVVFLFSQGKEWSE